jgi:hypothetical protein
MDIEEIELWIDIDQFNKRYSCSTTGFIYDKVKKRKCKTWITKSRKKMVILFNKNGTFDSYYLHIIIYNAFMNENASNFNGGADISFIDGERLNCEIYNLKRL